MFNLYVSTYQDTAELITYYAVGFNAAASSPNVEPAAEHLARHAVDVTNWAERKSLQVSAQKSFVTLFTSQTQQSLYHPGVPVNGQALPLDRSPTILGVMFDPHLFFHHHVDNLIKIANPRLNLLRLLCSTNWGQQEKPVLATSKSLIGSLITICSSILVS